MKKVSPAVEQGAELSEVDRLRWQLKYLREEIHMALLYIDAAPKATVAILEYALSRTK